ncbi:acyltransferase family protein [Rhodanobacter ginsengiterrae]|uniref:acyltransferase family protein n=1 Tax=Rhodanobacter ginsengiterrae TaxID=2008451 RepID=UPI003CF07C9E
MSRQHPSNNFDAVRLLAAGIVLCSHQFALTGRAEPRPFGLLTMGTFGVLVFFAVSGYLVAQSWDRDPHVLRFAAKRFLRVWPGLAVVTLVAALVLGPWVTEVSLHDYFRSPVTWDYFSQLYLGIRFHLPGVFAHAWFPGVNGSLWTIPIEVRWYGILLIAGVCGLLRRRLRYPLLLLVLAYATYVYAVFDVQHNPLAAFPLPDFGCEYGSYFCYGVVLYHFRDAWHRHPARLTGVLVVAAALMMMLDHGYTALFLLLPWLVIRFGTWSTPVLRRAGRFGDFSYGIYIYAYMMQQLTISLTDRPHPYWWGLLVSASCTLTCAILSWYLVERPALNMKRHLPGAVRPAGEVQAGTDGRSSTHASTSANLAGVRMPPNEAPP